MAKNASIIWGVVLALVCVGCAAPWETARNTIRGGQAAIEAVSEMIPDTPEATVAIDSLRHTFSAGDKLCSLWERLKTEDAPPGWSEWVSEALSLISNILDVLKSSDVDIPEVVLTSIRALQFFLPMLG